jgi:hypothetical protein
MVVFGDAVRSAEDTDTFIAFEYTIAKMAWVGTETPLLDAKIGAKRLTAGGYFKLTPAAETAAARTFGESAFIGPTAGHAACSAHRDRITGEGYIHEAKTQLSKLIERGSG